MAASNTLVQTLVDEDKRGRVMAFFTMAFFGMAPFGSLAAGALASRLGAPATVMASGVGTLIAVAVFARSLPAMRAWSAHLCPSRRPPRHPHAAGHPHRHAPHRARLIGT